ncbi:biotin--[acetyl-CoA-carboxylase] ligase [Corynebacterium sp. UMB6689]|uniref:biotin--[biotin carboxyl-carrier protein] ligase n=1 Tax=Corynebacterium aurimucosum TaxID=169292 RepID=A0A558GGP6_9CORY|nr:MULTISPECIES: biotin--[acetyl-CoA-carboxylase] ligase [Corynebacterium]MDK6813120.1 biotin--[acetyl-CoA-carboxylase] ligase [Corynebacterium sp. UMB6689]QQU95574.1 biotin--[acetyl-CoA-carboxylase] ligase [Corynebacterium aurimucosum]TVU56050.1 biotin--[acetyl-CoA-carboxylase] ligase [Corynebacterium aurimucosum]UTA72618.1 biotin--[acetyl-CoA-carboxylase] ligase [Corynebacterium aurimucosum]WJY69734.1 Bifunctional ligase/repressor BirA [Corynebacterium aurimucosum]
MTALDMDRIREALSEDFAVIDYTESTGSTNTDLMQAGKVADGTVLLANEQVAGKGRLGRQWVSPAGSQLIFSVLILPDSLDHLGTLPLAAGLAVTDSVEGAVLKWPNDVHIDGKKLCGILAEAGPVGEAFKSAPKTEVSKAEINKAEINKAEINKAEINKAEINKAEINKAEVSKAEIAPKTQSANPPSARVVVGMGINVTLTREELPIEAATSLALEGLETDRTQLAITVLKNLRRRITQWEQQDPQLLADYRKVCSSIGQEVRLEAPAGDVIGTVEGVADDGRINVGGEYYSAGDVIHLRPADN